MNKTPPQSNTFQRIQWTVSVPIKIVDGIFMADHHIAQDIDFFQTNKVTHVINCAGKQIKNCRNVNDVSFLTFEWSQNNIQNITDQVVVSTVINFIEECRREHGCLLVHYLNSQSRPFCLIACYFMIKFKWNLFKTLEFLNSRKEDIELEPAFFEQLTNFHQILQEKGLIKSKSWVLTENMTEEEVILTNTFLNSKKGKSVEQPMKKTSFKKKSVSWKNDLAVEYNYCPNSVITLNNPYLEDKKVNLHKERSDSLVGKSQKKQVNIKAEQKKNILSQMNVTKKWAELRQMWMKEKENQNVENCQNNTLVSEQKKKKDSQKINDRLQEKLNIFRKYEQKQESEATTKKVRKNQHKRQQKNDENFHKQNEFSAKNQSEKNSKTLHNNWIINNQVLKEINSNQPVTNKSKTNKSVIIVKPNHVSDHPSRSSLRKTTGSQKKPQRDETIGKMLKNEEIITMKGRCNSTKPQRKESPAIGLSKNNSFKTKGKWKF